MSSAVSPSAAQPDFRPPVTVAAGTTPRTALEAAGIDINSPTGAVVVRDSAGQLRDLDVAFENEDDVEPVRIDSPAGLAVLRHSTAHVLAQAVQQLFPNTLLGIGPPIENGFYYDFLPSRPFTPEDLSAIEKKMTEIIKAAQRFSRRPIAEDEARTELAHEKFKLELIGLKGSGDGADDSVVDSPVDSEEATQVGGGVLTMYDNLDRHGERVWTDLCRGPHLPTTRRIPAFKLMRSAAAYWRGDQQNEQLQRIYGTAWATKDDLRAYLARLEEAAKRDHRKLGAELDLFSFPDEIGSGLAVFHPKGGILRKNMEDYSRQRHIEGGYDFVNTPHIAKQQLFETSGHLPYYADGMFPPMEFEGTDYYLKAMNCPMHNLIFRSRGRSYRELPLRLFEFGSVYRYEKSGVVHGLTRVRGMTQDDAHIYCTKEQMGDELKNLLTFVINLLRDYGLDDFYLELSTRDDSPKFIGEPAEWEEATEALRQAALDSGLELVPDPGGAAYYGPKISVQARDAIGRTWQMSTIQVDFQQPKRFELEYTGADGERHRPVMIHRALFGSIERFIGVLTEHYAGAFPAWLSPVQVIGIPVSDDQVEYLLGVATLLRGQGIRSEVDASSDRMQKKIRTAQQSKVPFMLIAGAKDAEDGAVSFRFRDGEQLNGVPLQDAIDLITAFVVRRDNHSPSVADFSPVIAEQL
ncbi:threonine--tRNA ligase [Jatrophihabitans lederbergiae]|uniref:Threonine--tRNA ligase n=1 Tax=Jatrophihabitans lederbergiae TaxID=3075547 RepID=A0ABU2J948_9ACTN|nr:threonine--tRNA ligase [Jatrophihabitans sp. DSM 44399]MDT0261174.1 threonine--tRNA ligase [Jatrophihabitans sp. DSM 44399]